jgi:hypothetical protein
VADEVVDGVEELGAVEERGGVVVDTGELHVPGAGALGDLARERGRHDGVRVAGHHEDRDVDVRQLFADREAVAEQHPHRQERVVTAGDLSQRGERRSQHHSGRIAGGSELGCEAGGHAGADRLAQQHDALGGDVVPRLEVRPRGGGIAQETGLGGAPRVAAVPAVVDQQDRMSPRREPAGERQPVRPVAGVAGREQHEPGRLARCRDVPRGQLEIVCGREGHLLDRCGRGRRRGAIGQVDQLPLEPPRQQDDEQPRADENAGRRGNAPHDVPPPLTATLTPRPRGPGPHTARPSDGAAGRPTTPRLPTLTVRAPRSRAHDETGWGTWQVGRTRQDRRRDRTSSGGGCSVGRGCSRCSS